MNRYIYSIGIALSLVLGACDSGELTAYPSDSQPDRGVISFTLSGSAANGQALTRTETQTEAEQAVSTLYVAAYKGNQLKAVVSAIASSGTYTANVGASGSLDLYFIANPSEALTTALNALEPGTAPGALLALTESAAPAVDGTATNFLMTAHETKTVSSTEETSTDIGTIGLSRAAARIDITSVPTGFTLEKVTFKNRYTQTKLGRIGSDASMDGLTCNTAGQEYTTGITSGTTNTYVGYMYGYEDLAGTTQVVIDGKYNGLAVTGITVNFATAGEGNTPLPLQRNRVYSIALSKSSSSADLQNLVATLTVTDWDTSVTLSRSSADITNTTTAPTVAFSDFANCAVNGTNVPQIDVTDAAAASFKVTVTNTGSTLSKLVCTGLSIGGGAAVTTGEGLTITPGTVTYLTDGTSTQEFTVAVTANASGSQRVFTLKAENLLNRDTNVQFTVTQPAT